MVEHAFNPNSQEAEADLREFEAREVNRVSSWTTRAVTQRKHLTKNSK